MGSWMDGIIRRHLQRSRSSALVVAASIWDGARWGLEAPSRHPAHLPTTTWPPTCPAAIVGGGGMGIEWSGDMGGVKCSERRGWVGGGTFRSLGVGSCSHERSPPKGPGGYHTPQAAMGCAQCSNAEIEAENETVAALRAIAKDVHGRMSTTITTAEGGDLLVVQYVPRRKPEEIVARSADPAGQANACTLKKIRHHRTLPKSTILSMRSDTLATSSSARGFEELLRGSPSVSIDVSLFEAGPT